MTLSIGKLTELKPIQQQQKQINRKTKTKLKLNNLKNN